MFGKFNKHSYRSIAVALLFAVARVALGAPNFVDDNTALPGTKTDRFPPTNPSQQWTASDANTVIAALADLRTVVQRNPSTTYNVMAFAGGVAINAGSADAAPAINAAITAAATTVNGVFGGTVYLPKGTYRIGSQIVLPGGVALKGDNPANTLLRAASTFNGTALIRNSDQTGNQEYAFLESLQIDCNSVGGAVESEACVSWGSLFINSYIRNVIIYNSSSVGLHIFAKGSPGATGPVLIDNTWVLRNGTHNVLIEDDISNVGAFAGLMFLNLTSEQQGQDSSAIYLKGNGHAGQCNFYNTHIEQGGTQTNRTGITIDGFPNVNFWGVQLQAGNPANITAGITITSDFRNTNIQIQGVSNINLISPVLQDLKNSDRATAIAAFGNGNLPIYRTPEVELPGQRFNPGLSGNSITLKNSAGSDKVWVDSTGALTGSAPSGAALDVFGDATNDRAVTMLNHAKSRAFGFFFPDASSFRLRYYTGGVDLLQFSNTGDAFVYGITTHQSKVILQNKLASTGTAPTLSSCGTSPTVDSGATDVAGSFTTGSGATTCTVTFSGAYSATPTCVVGGSGVTSPTYTVSTTAITMSVDVASTKYNFICVGH